MSIEEVTMYRLVCDCCGASPADTGDYAGWADESAAIEEAQDADYVITDGGKHFCQNCVEWNETEDELVQHSMKHTV